MTSHSVLSQVLCGVSFPSEGSASALETGIRVSSFSGSTTLFSSRGITPSPENSRQIRSRCPSSLPRHQGVSVSLLRHLSAPLGCHHPHTGHGAGPCAKRIHERWVPRAGDTGHTETGCSVRMRPPGLTANWERQTVKGTLGCDREECWDAESTGAAGHTAIPTQGSFLEQVTWRLRPRS